MGKRSFFADRKHFNNKDFIVKINLILVFIFFNQLCFIFADDAIVPFDESWAINISAKYVITSFSQEQSGQYTTDRPWAMGLGIRYKNTSAALLLPSFYAFTEHPFESFDIQLSSYYDFMYYEAFCKRYQGFTEGEMADETDSNNIDLSVFFSGISAGWLLNGKNHSLSAAYDLDCKQLSSNGSPIMGFGVFYTSIFSNDKNINRYNDKQHFIYFGPNLGYTYTFIFSKNIFLNMNLVIGLDAGININRNKWLFIPIVMPKLSFGHHNKTWSINVSAGCHYTAIMWNIDSIDNLLPATMTVTFSKRF
jgi:hypothetical protein